MDHNQQHITIDGVDHILTWSDWCQWIAFDKWCNNVPKVPGIYEAKFMHEMNRLTIGKANSLLRRIKYLRTGTHSAGIRIRQNHPNELEKIVIRWAEVINPLSIERSLKQNHFKEYGTKPTYTRR